MADVLLFPHVCGRTPGVVALADTWRAAGHTVHAPDLFDGRLFATIDDGVAHVEEVGFDAIVERAVAHAADLPTNLVYAGISLGVVPAQRLAQTRGGAVGALVLFLAYFVGVALVGAGLGAAIANIAFSVGDREPTVIVVIGCAVLGAALASWLQRYVLIVGTAFGGAWTTIVGAVALLGDRNALAAALSRDVWVAYPLTPAPGQAWVPIAWVVLGLLGVMVQMGYTGGERGRVHRKKKPAAASA